MARVPISRIAVKRLGDVMNTPAEPITLIPTRADDWSGLLEDQGNAYGE